MKEKLTRFLQELLDDIRAEEICLTHTPAAFNPGALVVFQSGLYKVRHKRALAGGLWAVYGIRQKGLAGGDR